MSTERDTKFRGFAKLLMLELDIGPENDFTRQIIAQRAYDFWYVTARYAFNQVGLPDNPEEIQQFIAKIPDLTEWPEPSSPRLLDRSTWPKDC